MAVAVGVDVLQLRPEIDAIDEQLFGDPPAERDARERLVATDDTEASPAIRLSRDGSYRARRSCAGRSPCRATDLPGSSGHNLCHCNSGPKKFEFGVASLLRNLAISAPGFRANHRQAAGAAGYIAVRAARQQQLQHEAVLLDPAGREQQAAVGKRAVAPRYPGRRTTWRAVRRLRPD